MPLIIDKQKCGRPSPPCRVFPSLLPFFLPFLHPRLSAGRSVRSRIRAIAFPPDLTNGECDIADKQDIHERILTQKIRWGGRAAADIFAAAVVAATTAPKNNHLGLARASFVRAYAHPFVLNVRLALFHSFHTFAARNNMHAMPSNAHCRLIIYVLQWTTTLSTEEDECRFVSIAWKDQGQMVRGWIRKERERER